jgi:hypothetical protein
VGTLHLCGECAYFFFDPYTSDDQRRYASRLTFLHRNPSGHTSQEGEIFLFSQEHHTFFGQPTSPATMFATTTRMPL